MDFSRLRILVVEDSQGMRDILRTLLSAWGLRQLRHTGTVEGALELLKTEPFDLAIVDQRLGEGDGLELVRLIRAGATPFLPILMLTANASRAAVAAARDAGVNDFLAKPVTAETLYLRLQRIAHDQRPFVNADSYRGPERRRRRDPEYGGPDRRKS